MATFDIYRKIYRLAKRIPQGRVATYGQLAGIVPGCTARMVGYAMAGIPDNERVPWQRVVNSRGAISLRGGSDSELEQRVILEKEGIPFNDSGRIDLARYRWKGPSLGWLEKNGYHTGPV